MEAIKNYLKKRASRLGSTGLFLAAKPWLKTIDLKIAHYDVSANPARSEFGKPCVFVFWHEYILIPTMLWGHTKVTQIVSQHADADWLVHVAVLMGFTNVRGSTTRGGSAVIRACKQIVKTHSLAITPDGPKGPRREMAMGAVYLASRLQCPVVPVGFGYENPIRLKTWDEFKIPKPGSRVRALMGPKIHIPNKLKKPELEKYRLQIEGDLDRLTIACEEAAATGNEIDGQGTFLKNRNTGKPVLKVVDESLDSRLPTLTHESTSVRKRAA